MITHPLPTARPLLCAFLLHAAVLILAATMVVVRTGVVIPDVPMSIESCVFAGIFRIEDDADCGGLLPPTWACSEGIFVSVSPKPETIAILPQLWNDIMLRSKHSWKPVGPGFQFISCPKCGLTKFTGESCAFCQWERQQLRIGYSNVGPSPSLGQRERFICGNGLFPRLSPKTLPQQTPAATNRAR